jgi:hypothetical protein
MTELIGTHEIPCLSDTDYAAYALYMKCIAEQVEAQLVANQEAASAVLHRPMRVWFYDDAFADGNGGAGDAASGLQYSLNYPATFGNTTLATLNMRGWWRIGTLLRATSNAPILNNARITNLAIFPPNTPSALRNFTDGAWALNLQDIAWESNTGNGETLYTSGEVFNPGDPTTGPNDLGMRMRQSMSVESNAGAEVVTISGIYWAIYLGDTPSIDI